MIELRRGAFVKSAQVAVGKWFTGPLLMAMTCCIPALTKEHPFLWWTAGDLESIQDRLANDPVATQQWEKTQKWSSGAGAKGKDKEVWALFEAAVKRDPEAHAYQLNELRNFIGTQPETDAGGRWVVGNASRTDRHMRDEQTLNVLRYDVFYDDLTPAERAGIEDTFRVYIEFQLSGHRPIHPHFSYGRTATLPNMHWPRAIGTHLMAVALGDEALIDQLWNGYGGWFWFFDEYLADGFYMEEFAKYYSNVGTMLLVCEGLERLGLGDKYGYGYTSKSGATVRDFLFMPLRIAYPRTDIPGGRPNYRVVNMGDTPETGKFNGLHGIFGHSFVTGYLNPDQLPTDPKTKKRLNPGGNVLFSGNRMNGQFAKMLSPLWCEVGYRRFPDMGFDFFLSELRAPGEDVYLPTLYFNLGPIDPAQVKRPQVSSIVSKDRGFAFLKANQTTDYWTSGDPAVALQFGMYYVHYAHDCFSLLGFHGKNRPLYMRSWGGGKDTPRNHNIASDGKGYIGGHPWFDTVRGHHGVTVDNLKPRPVDSGNAGTPNQRIRSDLNELAQFTAVAADGLYPGVQQERALVLTKEYLFDVFANRSDRARQYDWSVNGAGTLAMPTDAGWQRTHELAGAMLYRDLGDPQPAEFADGTLRDSNDPVNVHRMKPTDETWSTYILQDCTGVAPADSLLGPAWYDRQVGVRVSMANDAAAETTLFGGRPPLDSKPDQVPTYSETGGAWLMARRTTAVTNFVALHEPFENGAVPTTLMYMLVDKPDQVVAIVIGQGFKDIIGIALGDDIEAPRDFDIADSAMPGALRGRFVGNFWARWRGDTIHMEGGIQSLALPVSVEQWELKGDAVNTISVEGGRQWAR